MNSHFRQIENTEGATAESQKRQKEAVREVYNYCDNLVECRRVQILHHFDESFDKEDCAHGCDNCLEGRETVRTDVTTYAKAVCRILKCLTQDRTEKVSKTQLFNIVNGSNCLDVRSKGHESLGDFGACKGLDKGLTEQMFNKLEYRDIIATISELNIKGFHNDYMVVMQLSFVGMERCWFFCLAWILSERLPERKSIFMGRLATKTFGEGKAKEEARFDYQRL